MITPILPTYARADVAFERGEGSWLIATDGRRFLDFGSGIAVNSCGHSHPHLVKALTEQAAKLWHTSNLYQMPEGKRLAERLIANTFADTVFFCNSGAEANEAAIKMARKYHAAHGHPEKFRIITFEGAFHGRTLATIAAGGQKKYLDGFGPKVEGFDQVPFGDHDALKAAITDETAAILIEPVQGEGGIRSVPPQCLRGLRQLCDEKGLLLIYDEVQTGVGRSGKLFAHEWAGRRPTSWRSPRASAAASRWAPASPPRRRPVGMTAGTHGTTFGGNPLAMAVGNAVLDVILAPGFLEEVQRKALYFKQKLAAFKDRHSRVIEDVRGEGLLMGVKTRIPNTEFQAAAREAGLLSVGAGDNVVRLIPPLTVSEAEIDEALKRLEAAAHAVEAKLDRPAAE